MSEADMSKELDAFNAHRREHENSNDPRDPIWAAWIERAKLDSGEWVSVPKGWKLVPIEPTDEMISEGADASKAFRVDILRSYEAMVNAAPQPPEETK